MRSRSVVVGAVLAVVLSAVFAVLFVRAFDARGPIWNGGWQIRVSGDAAPVIPAAELYGELVSLAGARGIDVARFVEDAEDPAGVRHLFVVGDGASAELLRGGYQAVDTSRTTTVAPLVDLGSLDVRGAYLVAGDRAEADAVLAVIEAGGWTGTVHPYPRSVDLDSFREYGDLLRALIVAVLGVVILIGAGTVLRSRAHGVQRLHGAGFAGILISEWRGLAAPVACWSAAGLASVVLATAGLNGLAQSATLVALFADILGIVVPAAIVSHLAGIALTDGRHLVDQVKGEIDGWWVLVGVYAVRVPAVLVLLAVVAALGQSARVAELENRTREFWSSAQDAVILGISGYLSQEEYLGGMPAFADLVSSQASEGALILAEPGLSVEPDVLLVDEGYLRAVEVLGEGGSRITDVPDGVVTVLEPEGTSPERRRVVLEDVRAWQETQSGVAVPASGTVSLGIEERVLPRGQTLFTFRSTDVDVLARETSVEDPVLVVLPSIDVYAPSEVYSAITRGAVLFTDPGAVPDALRERGLEDQVVALTPVAYQANEQYQRALGTLSINVLGLVSGTVVVLLTGLVSAMVMAEKDRRRAFVHRIAGLGPLSAHRSGLVLEGVLLLGAVAVSVVPMWFRDPRDVRTVLDLGTVDTERFVLEQSLLALGLTALSSALLVACLALARHRAARPRSDDS
ncbi:hypothetical protein [Rathayibacter sp. Leaf296]|uniref:hypothetical protein n=1 Tax=Rathayibacter sp. Leaf296 TaxID=1736327 RepID=UPI0007037BF1|nr:hypothetical protein [Rathayibacter sp. Leaf296]KQQ08672.1 hypothetical protein ASF46_15520 [Rathayibacter sp. Leaf296]